MNKANEVLQILIDRDIIGLDDFYTITMRSKELNLQGYYNKADVRDINESKGFTDIIKTFKDYPTIEAMYNGFRVIITLTD